MVVKRARRNFLAVLGGVAVTLPMTRIPTPANVYDHLKHCWNRYETQELLNGVPIRKSGVTLSGDGSFSVLADAGRDVMRINPMAARIWDMCDGKNGSEDIARAISKDYDVSPGVCLRDVMRTLRTFRRQGLIVC
jgi:pyrroloquinoline quinone biosynthesis protein D